MSIIQKSNILTWSKEQIDLAPEEPGVYVLRNLPSLNGIIYIGCSENLRSRLNEHWNSTDIPEITWFDWYQTDSVPSARSLEKGWISQYAPKYNQNIG